MTPEHNLFSDLLGSITLPLFALLALGMMAGAKPDSIFKGYMGLVGTIIGGMLKLALGLFSLITRELLRAGSQRASIRQQYNSSYRNSYNNSNKSRSKVYGD